MIIGVGLVLLGLTLYMSTLAYTLRDFSRARLSELLTQNAEERRLSWLDQHKAELQMLTAFVRVTANLGIMGCVGLWYFHDATQAIEPIALVAPILITLLLLLLFAIGLPHGLATHVGESILSHSFTALLALRTMLWPIARVLAVLEFIVRRLLGKADESKDAENERMEQEILDAVSEGEAHGAVDEDQKEIIESVFEFGDTHVDAIMTPRTDVHAIQADATYDEARQAVLQSGHSRIPVYEQTVDHIVGVLYAKDLLRLNPGDAFEARKLMRTVPYVPETKSIDDLLDDFRQSKVQIAIVLDEYGGTAGVVTIEDILEELVGEIDDEYDMEEAPTINRVDQDTLEVDARVHIDEVNEELHIELPEEEDYETIGGFVFSTLGKIPTEGEEFQHDNIAFKIMAAEARKINRVRIHVVRQAESA